MKLSKVEVKNFRLLQSVSMELTTEKMATVLVGPNNSGKTSAAEVLLMFLNKGTKDFSISDFSLGCRADFDTFQNNCLLQQTMDTVMTDVVASEDKAQVPTSSNSSSTALLPYISLVMRFDYSDDGPDLAVAGELLMDLDVEQSTVAVEVRFAVQDPERLATEFRAERDEKQSLMDFLGEHLHQFYGLELYKVSPDGLQSTKIEDRSILDRLIKVDIVSAQRHIDDREHNNSKATRLSALWGWQNFMQRKPLMSYSIFAINSRPSTPPAEPPWSAPRWRSVPRAPA